MRPLGSERVFDSVVALGVGEIVARSLAFFATVYLARRLGPSHFGILSLASALSFYLFLPVVSSLDSMGAREIARRPGDAKALALSTTLLRLILACVAMSAVVVVALWLDLSVTLRNVLLLTGVSFFSTAIDTSWVFKGLERNRLAGLSLVMGQFLYAGGVLWVVAAPEDVVWAPVARFLAEIITALLLGTILFRRVSLRVDLSAGWRVLKSARFVLLTRVLRTLIFNVDLLVLGLLLGEREAGLYAVPYRFCFVLVALVSVIHVAYLPAFTRARLLGASEVSRLAGRAMELSAAVGLPLIVGGTIVSEPLLRSFFGPAYIEGLGAFRLLLPSIGFYFAYGVLANVMLVSERTKIETAIMAVVAAGNLFLNLILIPRYALEGAAVATLISEASILILGWAAVVRIGVSIDLKRALRPFASAGVMAIGLFVIGLDRGLWLLVPAGGLIYLGMLFGTRSLPHDAEPFAHRIVSTLRNRSDHRKAR